MKWKHRPENLIFSKNEKSRLSSGQILNIENNTHYNNLWNICILFECACTYRYITVAAHSLRSEFQFSAFTRMIDRFKSTKSNVIRATGKRGLLTCSRFRSHGALFNEYTALELYSNLCCNTDPLFYRRNFLNFFLHNLI